MVLVSASELFADRAAEFFFFAACMGAVLLVFMWLARRYRYVNRSSSAA